MRLKQEIGIFDKFFHKKLVHKKLVPRWPKFQETMCEKKY